MTDSASQLRSVVERIQDNLILIELPADARKADALARALSTERPVKIVVVGEFNSGKSTFVNALCGLNLLPSGIVPTTATINIVENSSELSIVAIHADGSRSELGFAPDILQRYTARNGEHRDIREIRVGAPNLPPNLILVDTPGVNDINETRSEIVYEMLPEADVIVFLMDIQQPMKRSEVDFLRSRVLRASVVKTIFVLNHIDRVQDPNDLQKAVDYVRVSVAAIYSEVAESFLQAGLEHLAQEIRHHAEDVPVFTISAKQMLRSIEGGRSIEGDPLNLRLAILGLAAPEERLRTSWTSTISQAFGLLARLRGEVEEQQSMRRMERDRVVVDAHRNGEVLRKTLQATSQALKHIDSQRVILRSESERAIDSIFMEASSIVAARIESSGKDQGMLSVQQEIGRKLEIRMELLNKGIQRLATESTRQAAAFIPMRVSNPSLTLGQDGGDADSSDWLADILQDPVYGTGVMMLAPVAAFLFGWVGFAVVALPFVARMFGKGSTGIPLDQIKTALMRSGDDVKGAVQAAIAERLDAISMAVVDVLEEPQQRVRTACAFLSSQGGPQEMSFPSLVTQTLELESELADLKSRFDKPSPHRGLADRLGAFVPASAMDVKAILSCAAEPFDNGVSR